MRVSEVFTSYQGSGYLSGTRQLFVRFQGCSMPCPIRAVCDEPTALEFTGGLRVPVTPEDVVDMARETGWLHITGGEPMDQPDAMYKCLERAMLAGVKTQVQTSGLRKMRVLPDYLTVSPKSLKSLVQLEGNEVVLVYDPKWVTPEVATEIYRKTSFKRYYIQPLQSGSEFNGEAAVKFCNELNKDDSMVWGMTCQMHKYLGIR